MLNDYIASVDKIELLTAEEEQKLWKAYEESEDMQARMTIIEHYQPLVLKEANVYKSTKVDMMDCIQEGTIGLIEAVERYDSTKGVAFSLYAVHRIRGRILDYLRKEGKEGVILQEETEDGETWWEQLPAEGPSIEIACEERMYGDMVTSAMKQLPLAEQHVMEEVYYKDHSVASIADMMECSHSYIHRLRRKGLARLKGMLETVKETWDNS